jgi:leader peptidase (prepilin peptidase) / N-methyltransferase
MGICPGYGPSECMFVLGATLLFGACFGSFLNVLIYRMPRRESIVYPSSRCPSCATPIHWYDNIPVASWLILRGRCRSCDAPISVRYPIVEAGTAVALALLVAMNGLSVNTIAFAVLTLILIPSALIDLEHTIIPNRLTYPGFIIALAATARWGVTGPLFGLGGSAVGLGILFGMSLLGRLMYRRESMGMGDFKLIAVIGCFLGPLNCAIALFLAVFAGGVTGVVLMITKRYRSGQEIPFGPFLALGGYAVMLFHGQIFGWLQWYLSIL